MTKRRSKTSPPDRWPSPEEAAQGPITDKLVRAADIHGAATIIADEAYLAYMETHVRPFPIAAFSGAEHRKTRLSHYKLIRCPSQRAIFILIWKNSPPFLTALAQASGALAADIAVAPLALRDLALGLWTAEHNRRAEAARVNGAGAYLDESQGVMAQLTGSAAPLAIKPEKQHKYEVQMTRLADAAATYDLVERHVEGARLVIGTHRLHEMMIRLEGGVFCEIAAAIKEANDE